MAHDYTLAAVVLSLGTVRIGGSAESGFVSAEKKEDDYEVTDMQDGEMIYSFKGSRIWMVTATLSQHSGSNAILSAIRLADLNSSRNGLGGLGILPGGLAYTNGTTLLVSPAARIIGPPKVVYTNKPEDREWKICFPDCVDFIGT